MVLFEDEWPSIGDHDFNDQSIAVNYIFVLNPSGDIVGLQATFNALSIGAAITNGLYLHLPIPASTVSVSKLTYSNGLETTQSILTYFAGQNPAEAITFPTIGNTACYSQ